MRTEPSNVTLANRLLKVQLIAILAALPVVAQTQIAPQQHAPFRLHERRYDGTVTSENWSGYAVTGSNFTDVKGSWVVPAVTCPTASTSSSSSPHSRSQPQQQQPDEYAAFWVGLDGYSSNTVEQLGTDSDCDGSTAVYYAWFEFYPHPSYLVNNLSVAPGNRISAEVNYNGKTFTVTLTNESTGQSFSASTSVPSAARSSAEWIAEAPSSGSGPNSILSLADFGLVDFGGDTTGIGGTCEATMNGTANPIGKFSTVEAITMVTSSNVPESTPSALSSDGTSFSMSYSKP